MNDTLLILLIIAAPAFALAAGWLCAICSTRNKFRPRQTTEEQHAAHAAVLRKLNRHFRNP